MRITILVPFVFLSLGLGADFHAAHAQESCSRFRGANADGVSADNVTLPETWSTTENVAWAVDVPGRGWSCPIIVGNRVFVTTVSSEGEYESPKKGLYQGLGRSKPPSEIHHWIVLCFDIHTGEKMWEKELHSGQPEFPRHPKSNYAAETPVTDGTSLFVLFGDLGLYRLDFDGNVKWEHRLEAQPSFLNYGAASSPVVHDGQIIMVYDNMKSSYIASYDAASGEERWRTDRDSKSTWATPYVWKTASRAEIVVAGKREIISYDLAGDPLWSLEGRMSNLIIPSPFAIGELLYVTSGYVGDTHRPTYAIRPGAEGDISLDDDATSNEFVAWYHPKTGPYNTTPIVYRDRYFTLHDRGFFTCHDAKTGEEIYDRQRMPAGATFTASPWAYNGKVFCLSEDGSTYVIPADGDFEITKTNKLDELALATPSVAQGRLFVRTDSKLYCLMKNSDE